MAAVSMTDKISEIGGLIGLFNGFCMISGVEIFYFIALWFANKIKIPTSVKALSINEGMEENKSKEKVSFSILEIFYLNI